MKFLYSFAELPKNPKVLMSIDSAAERLFQKLKKLDLDSLKISAYTKRYLKSKLDSLTTNLQIYSYILSWATGKSNCQFDRFVFLDYGGGSGILSLLGKELGIGTVIYNDIYEISCRDAQEIGKAVGCLADHYVHGDIDQVISFLKRNRIDCDSIASYDVIEHIYNIESFFEKLSALSNNSLSVVMSSGANSLNPFIRKRLMKKQIEEEYKDRDSNSGHKERDCLRSYFNVRKDMIIEYSKQCNRTLTRYEVEELARRTRGKIAADIQKWADNYFQTKRFPQGPNHPSNTCDPYTGNWTEHLMNPHALAGILAQTGFQARVISGYYGRSKSLKKRVIGKFLNIFIGKFESLRIAPYFTIYGTRI